MLASGGNAIDAALTANLVLAVVTPYMCGVGGDLLAMVFDGDVHAYRGVGRAPHGATLDAVREQSGAETMPVFGPHPCTVPGGVDGWFTLLERWGEWAEPLGAPVRGPEILEMPPPTQASTALEALRIVDGLDLGPEGPDRQHLLIEAMQLALADRDAHLGDPDAMSIACDTIL